MVYVATAAAPGLPGEDDVILNHKAFSPTLGVVIMEKMISESLK